MRTFRLQIVTPDGPVLDVPARSVRLPGSQGAFGVLPGHAPLVASLRTGAIKLEHENGDVEYVAASGGFAEVTGDSVIVLAESAERSRDIDVERVRQALEHARAALAGGGAVSYEDAQRDLERATNQLRVVQKQDGT